jgi:hypothetical protein
MGAATVNADCRARSAWKLRRCRGSRKQQTTRYHRRSPHVRQHYARTRVHVTAPDAIAEREAHHRTRAAVPSFRDTTRIPPTRSRMRAKHGRWVSLQKKTDERTL